MAKQSDHAEAAGRAFRERVEALPFGMGPLILGHFDADGLSAVAILARALERLGRPAEIRLVGKGENPWSPAMREELARRTPAGLIIADLGVREGEPVPGVPTIVIDHHVPTGVPGEALVISGNGLDPEPTSSLLAYWCAVGSGPAEDLLWLAALGLIGDMAEDAGFPEMAEAQRRYGKTALREAVSLINAPRRAAAADARPALALLMAGAGPKDVTSGRYPETAELLAARAEVREALNAAKKIGPKIRGDVALIRFASPCQIHPLLAQQWRARLKDKIVLAANTGYRPGWVHFAARTAGDTNLIRFLAGHRPAGADENYGSGHIKATGGALRPADWNAFAVRLGFPEAQVEA
ncbi:DHH family phosphoesterase [Sphingosinicella sp. CPCC 101087]|uniref:DHH family phosphoesterase n=1 Tax=Sphingosinicella sp. CPCC 101087 TaxID=2497754 RepID=UPI00101D50FD|nr:DHH family phosphoesterase [Sphingosinicella sp. CPCC 101087]